MKLNEIPFIKKKEIIKTKYASRYMYVVETKSIHTYSKNKRVQKKEFYMSFNVLFS